MQNQLYFCLRHFEDKLDAYTSMQFNAFLCNNIDLGAVYMSRASPVSRAELSHENRFMTVTDNFNQLYDFLTTKLS